MTGLGGPELPHLNKKYILIRNRKESEKEKKV